MTLLRTQPASRSPLRQGFAARGSGETSFFVPQVRDFGGQDEGRSGRAIFSRGCGHDAGTGQSSQGFNGWSARVGGVTGRVRSLAGGIEAGREDLLWR